VGGTECFINCRKHAFQVPIHFVVPEAKDPIFHSHKEFVTDSITPRMDIEIVLSAVNLDDEVMLGANEVHDVGAEWRLPSEMEAAILPGAKVNPELHLLSRHSLA
jgi:hypothetical protein